jgi:hypothetical protein
MRSILGRALSCLVVLWAAGCGGDAAPTASSTPDPQARFDQLLATFDQQFLTYLASTRQAMGRDVLAYAPIADGLEIPKRMDIAGTHYDLGYLIGDIARQHGRLPRQVPDDRRALNDQIVEMYRRVYPRYLDLVEGVADAFGRSPGDLDLVDLEGDFFVGLWTSIFRHNEFDAFRFVPAASSSGRHCAVVSARLDREPITGRNFDNSHERPHFVVYTNLEGAYRVLANAQYSIYHWVMDGINEKGLFMATANNAQPSEYMFTDPYPSVPAMQEHHLFRAALETCATVDEVVALYGSVRPWSQQADHLLVADAEGSSAVIEFALDRSTGVFRTEATYQVLTNIAYHEGFDYMMANCNRFRQTTNEAEAGIADLEELARVMAAIRSPAGYLSLFDLRVRSMTLYLRRDFVTAWHFDLP